MSGLKSRSKSGSKSKSGSEKCGRETSISDAVLSGLEHDDPFHAACHLQGREKRRAERRAKRRARRREKKEKEKETKKNVRELIAYFERMEKKT